MGESEENYWVTCVHLKAAKAKLGDEVIEIYQAREKAGKKNGN